LGTSGTLNVAPKPDGDMSDGIDEERNVFCRSGDFNCLPLPLGRAEAELTTFYGKEKARW